MIFARHKRLLLGWMALTAPIPLPFNQILAWPGYAAYALVVVAFLFRAHRDPGGWLPAWAMNLLAIVYLPYFAFDLKVLSQGRLVVAVTHLLLFTVLVKLFALRRERDKWQTAIAIFFLFLTSMATSVHPAVAIYLVGFLGLSLLLFARFAQLHLVAGFAAGEQDLEPLLAVPIGRFLALATLATLLLSAPLFVFMPRVRNPLVTGTGRGMGTTGAATGFSDGVTLDTIGTIRTSREVAMRLRYDGPPPPGHEMRFKGGSYDVYRNGSWLNDRNPRSRSGVRAWGSTLRLGLERPTHWVDVFLRPVTGTALMVPVDGVVVQATKEGVTLYLDSSGVVRSNSRGSEPMEYRVGLEETGAAAAAAAPDPVTRQVPPATLDTGSVGVRVSALAAEVAGDGTPAEQARRIERHLMRSYEYSLEFLGQPSVADPVEAFLFERRTGHCEYFASAMVLMLRARGIPARLATGFLGADYNSLEDYYVVRQSNAHAWVEAYLPESGWTVFDPTPPGGRPESSTAGLGSLLGQSWDYLLFRWDRYVLTYGFNDQMQFLSFAYGFWHDLTGIFGGDEAEAASGPGEWVEALLDGGPEPEAREEARADRLGTMIGLVAVLALLASLGVARHARRPLSALEAYRRLRRIAGDAGLTVREADPPLRFARRLGQRFPHAATPGAELIGLYVKESFGGEALAQAEAARLQDVLAETVRVLRKAG